MQIVSKQVLYRYSCHLGSCSQLRIAPPYTTIFILIFVSQGMIRYTASVACDAPMFCPTAPGRLQAVRERGPEMSQVHKT